jgi:RNA 2',3'-cyclic 3'-phosphodiesterase
MMTTYDYPPIDRMNVERPTQHAIMILAYPKPADAAEISDRNDRFRHRAGLHGRALLTDRLHITLFSLGIYLDVPDDLIAKASKAAAMIVSPPIEVIFNRLETFGRNSSNKPMVLTGDDGLNPVRRFRQDFAMKLIEVGLKKFAKSSFTPHMTLLYDPRTIKRRAIDPVRWTMTEFVLVDSLREQTRHVPIGRWQLRGEPNG